MPVSTELLDHVTSAPAAAAWQAISDHLWTVFSAPIAADAAESEVVRRDHSLTQLENVLAGAAWDLWHEFEGNVSTASESLVKFWEKNSPGRAVLILDALSLRETPWLLMEAARRGYKIREAGCRGSDLPADTTPFARNLGFGQRSSLDNNQAGSAHQLKGAYTDCGDLNWLDCVSRVGAQADFVYWHHWPDARLHAKGVTLHLLAREVRQQLTSDDFWSFIDRLTTGRRLVITGDHGYAACGDFHDISDKDQAAYMKSVYGSMRNADDTGTAGTWVPPIDLRLTSSNGTRQYVLGRRKWKSPGGYPALQHGGLSLLEVFVPFIELTR